MVGALNVRREGAPFSQEEVELVERFATMAALAYDSARQRDVAKTDGLTGLLNHRGSQERLRAALEVSSAVSVVVLDLDHFKRVNDRHGHAEGDRVLAAAAKRLRSVVRDSDAVGRLGGEEFVLVLPGMDAAEAREVAERARAAVSEVMVGGKPLECSAGVAAHPADADGAAELLAAADAALYAAKDGGRKQTRRYRASLARRPLPGEEREEVEALLRTPGGIVPFFQPVLELATGRVSGYEALARMEARPPDEWFAQAHRAGLGAELEAAAVTAALAAPGRPAGTFLAVNVSPRALVSAPVMDALPDDLSSMVVELTEHDLFGADDTLHSRLAELRAPRRARGARRRRLGLRRAAAAHPRGARHPQARPLARPRRARRPRQAGPAGGADLVRRLHRLGGLRRGHRGSGRPARARRPRRHLRAGLRARAARAPAGPS